MPERPRSKNPLLEISDRIAFGQILPEEIEPAIDLLIGRAQQALDAIATSERPLTYAKTFGALDEATEGLSYAMSLVSHLEAVATTPALRDVYSHVRPKVSAFYASIPLNEPLYASLKSYADDEIKQDRRAGVIGPTEVRFVDLTLDEFRRSGAALQGQAKDRLRTIEKNLAQLTMRFAQNALDATNDYELIIDSEARLGGLPAHAKKLAQEDATRRGKDGYRFTLQGPSVVAVLTHLDDRAIREQVWRAYNGRARDTNAPLIKQILSLRQEKAKLLGYGNFADLVIEERMAASGRKAAEFIDQLREYCRSAFQREKRDLLEFARQHDASFSELEPWDVAYFAEKLRKQRHDIEQEELRAYFQVDRVLKGLFELAEQLFDIEIVPNNLPTWHESVESYAIRDRGGAENLRALFYVDLYPRESKRGGAWMQPLYHGSRSLPSIGLMCANVTPPTGDQPALLTHREVQTLFHEFGHLLHHALSEVKVRGLAGTQVPWDFVELPSQLLENWCWESEALDLFAVHQKTGKPLPTELITRLRQTRAFREGTATMRQLGFAALDLALHQDDCPRNDSEVLDYARDILRQHSPVPLPDDYAMVASFSHLFAHPVGYAAGYYSYKWAEVLDADAYSQFRADGVVSKRIGRAFREKILSKGNSKAPLALYTDFMGREPSLEPLLERAGLLQGDDGAP